MAKTFQIGGIHPNDSKFSANCSIEDFPLVPKVYISMNQHLGGPAIPVVEKGDQVQVGQLIAKPSGFISAPVHSSVSGKVASIGPFPDILGNMCNTIVINVEEDQWLPEIDRSPDIEREIKLSGPELIQAVAEKGIVGLGGATFPANVKLSPPQGKTAEFIILNGTECEPFLTSDHRIMLERTEEILIGGEIIRRALGTEKGYVGIEINKPDAIEKMKNFVGNFPHWEIVPLKKRYPQGGEKQLIDAITGRQVPSMALPIDVGAVVHNVGTALAIYEAVQKNKPLIDNVLTVTGTNTAKQKNYRVRIGTPIQALIDSVGGVDEDIAKLISGGPMMGRVIVRPEAPTLKGTSSVLMLTEAETLRKEPSACIRCAKCVSACPMGLEPYLLYRMARANRLEDLEKHFIQDCIECGCCMYTCPANIALLDMIRLKKGKVLGMIRSRAQGK